MPAPKEQIGLPKNTPLVSAPLWQQNPLRESEWMLVLDGMVVAAVNDCGQWVVGSRDRGYQGNAVNLDWEEDEINPLRGRAKQKAYIRVIDLFPALRDSLAVALLGRSLQGTREGKRGEGQTQDKSKS